METKYISKMMKSISYWHKTRCSRPKAKIILSIHLDDFFQSVHCTASKNNHKRQKLCQQWMFISGKHFLILILTDIVNWTQHLILSVYYCWTQRSSLQYMDHTFPVSWIIRFENSSLDIAFCYPKVFRLHAELHVAVGVLQSHSDTGLYYC